MTKTKTISASLLAKCKAAHSASNATISKYVARRDADAAEYRNYMRVAGAEAADTLARGNLICARMIVDQMIRVQDRYLETHGRLPCGTGIVSHRAKTEGGA